MRLNSLAGTKWGVLLAVVAIGFLLRLWLMFGNGTASSPEVFEYDELARNMLSGGGVRVYSLGDPVSELLQRHFLHVAHRWPVCSLSTGVDSSFGSPVGHLFGPGHCDFSHRTKPLEPASGPASGPPDH